MHHSSGQLCKDSTDPTHATPGIASSASANVPSLTSSSQSQARINTRNDSSVTSTGNHRRTTSNSNPSNASNNSAKKDGHHRELVKPLSLKEACADGSPPPPLCLMDRVVWISDNGPEYGVVKWLGKLPDVGPDWMAGVDFDNQVGSGTGLYNDHQLFETKMNHASLVPVIGLMKADDFLCATSHSSPTTTSSTLPSLLPLKPKRTKNKKDDKLNSTVPDGEITSSFSKIAVSSMLPSNHDESQRHANSNSGSSMVNRSISTTNKKSSSQPNFTSYINSVSSLSDKKKQPAIAVLSESNHSSHNNSSSPKSQSKTESNFSQLNGSTSSATGHKSTFEVGSVVEVMIDSIPRYGVVRWIGILSENVDDKHDDENEYMAGVELEDEISGCTDGTWNGKRYFECAPRRGYFVKLTHITKDGRFTTSFASERRKSALFGSIDCPSVTGDVPPLNTPEDLQALCGKNRGIQGHHNSCYLDATLFAMFSCTTIFESLLHRPPRHNDITEYAEVQRILKEEIVNPLRANLYVRADRVMHLRQLLEKISSVRGLTSEEKDPEEFLNLLLNEILKADPFLKLSSGLESFFYQLILEKDEKLTLPTVQQLFDQSFLQSDIKLRQVPPCLLIQMPRFGRQFKMYPRIIPSLYLDITDVLENSPRQCSICGQVAEFECKECFGQFGEGLDSIAFCGKCLDKSHSHKKRSKHKTTKLKIPTEFSLVKEHTQIPRIYMELFAVLCIETSHYVSFVKCGSGPDSPWCFFDSMADRKGEQNGYNIPEIVSFPDLRWWLSEEGIQFLHSTKDDKVVPEMPRRLLCDAYILWYASDVVRYR